MSEQTLDMATIVNRALVGIGMPPSFSVSDTTSFGLICQQRFALCRDRVFSLHDWSFLRRTSRLVRHATTPQNGWTYGFDLPGDRLGAPLKLLTALRPECTLRDYQIEGSSVYCQETALWARCKVALDPQYWDSGFVAAFITALEGYLAVPQLQDLELETARLQTAFGASREGGAAGLFGRLIAQDLAAQPIESPFTRGDPLSDARWE